MNDFARSAAIVTGGAGGIGACVVAALAARGAAVAAVDLKEPAAESGAALSIRADLTEPEAVRSAVGEATERLGPIGMLVCATGVVSEYALACLEPGEWHRIVDASLTAAFLVTRAVVPAMAQRGEGRVVAFSSGWATKGYPKGAHYAAAKAGIEALVKSLALETAADGVRVNAIAPGPVDTGFVDDLAPDRATWRRERAALVPLGRVAEPADLVGPTLFLLGPDSDFVTGQVLHVNGGMLLP
ncbi:SDR family NAD(P)-dependent oxidoreductase [Streptomyces puniciscabiei]